MNHNPPSDESLVIETITSIYSNVETTEALGFTFFFYQSERNFPFATLLTADTDHDTFSDLNRPGVYRLNIGISKAAFQTLFGPAEHNPADYDYTALDVLLPHPEYAQYHFVCVLSPVATWPQVQTLLAEAHEIAARRFHSQNKPR